MNPFLVRASVIAVVSTTLSVAVWGCSGEVTSGEGGAGGASSSTTASSSSKTAGGTQTVQSSSSSTANVPVTSTASGGQCPADPIRAGCSNAAAAMASSGGGTQCSLSLCQGGVDDWERHCTTETSSCTCSQGDVACTCAWDGDCSNPCCGPTDFF